MADPATSFSPGFVRRTLFVFGAAAFVFICWQLAEVFLLAFGAVIVAVLLRSIAEPIRDRTPLNDGASLAIAGLLVLTGLGAAGWLFGSTVSGQVAELADRIPRSTGELRDLVATLPFGEVLAENLGGLGDLAARFQGSAGQIGGYAMSVAGAATNILLVLVAGVFLAIKPGQARDGVVLLLPDGAAESVKGAMNASGRALRLWLMGTLADMVVVGVLTGIGTAMIGLPSPVALGLFAGLVCFVPIVGPIVSVAPGLLLAAQGGPQLMLWTVLVYFAVQQIESNLIYPFIQRRAVDLAPVVTLFSVVGFGILLGPLGVIFATPLIVVLTVFIKRLYIRETLGREVEIPGEDKP